MKRILMGLVGAIALGLQTFAKGTDFQQKTDDQIITERQDAEDFVYQLGQLGVEIHTVFDDDGNLVYDFTGHGAYISHFQKKAVTLDMDLVYQCYLDNYESRLKEKNEQAKRFAKDFKKRGIVIEKSPSGKYSLLIEDMSTDYFPFEVAMNIVGIDLLYEEYSKVA